MDKKNPDIVMLNETKLNEKHTVYFKNYKIIRNDRPNARKGGGTAIIIKKGIKHETIHINTRTEVIETTAIRLNTSDNNKLILIAIYAKKGPNAKFREELEKLFIELDLMKQSNYYVIAGDFNAKHESWANKINDERGIALKEWIDNNDIKYRINLFHTAVPSFPRYGSFIDLILADARIEFSNSKENRLNTVQLASDHEAITALISIPSQNIIRNQNEENITYNFAKADWKKFQNALQSYNPNIEIDRNLTKEEIDKYIQEIEHRITDAMDLAIPKPKPQNSIDKYLTKRIRRLIKEEKNTISAHRRILRAGTIGPLTNHVLRILNNRIKALKNKIRVETQRVVNDYWYKRIKQINPSKPDKIFKEINCMYRKKATLQLPTLKIPENNTKILNDADIDTTTLHKDSTDKFEINNITDKLNILGTQYATVNEANVNLNSPAFNNIIENKYKQITKDIATTLPETICKFSERNNALSPTSPKDLTDYFTDTSQVQRKFKTLNNKKSAGNDKIPNLVLKNIPKNITKLYTILFNNMLNHAYFPEYWKKAKTLPILKKGKDSSNPSSYRPISLLSNVGKIFERIINDIIIRVCNDKKLIPENQFGFRRHHSTIHAINKLSSDVNWALNGGACVGACLVDLEKAFDTVWLNGLIVKLYRKEFPLAIIKLIHSMIYSRSFQVSIHKEISSKTFSIANGLQQGTINSPILFNIYTSDSLNLFGPDSTGCSMIAYADDLIIYRTDKTPNRTQQTLQKAVDKIFAYYKAWKLRVNTSKCETILFRPSCRRASSTIIKQYKNFSLIDVEKGTKIQHKDAVKYLGILLDNRFLMNKHVELQLQKAKNTFIANAKLFYSKNLNKKVKLICYQLLIRPIITYGCEIWYNIGASIMEMLRVFERRCLRACLSLYRSPSSNYQKYINNTRIYNTAKINRIDNFIIKLIRNYFATAAKITSNSMIFPIPYPDDNYIRKTINSGYIPPEAFILLDKQGYIQNEEAVPLLYHIPRHRNNKAIKLPHEPIQDKTYKRLLKYSTTVPQRNYVEYNKIDHKKVWWLKPD
ncbi:RNA-directed DNA polymerase from mobile element jockey [Anthophora plagiata]